jgi:hypothetical protein
LPGHRARRENKIMTSIRPKSLDDFDWPPWALNLWSRDYRDLYGVDSGQIELVPSIPRPLVSLPPPTHFPTAFA